jgi:hypothetical protein
MTNEKKYTDKAIDRVVAYIDILGFKKLTERALKVDDTILSQVYDALLMMSATAILKNKGPFNARELAPFAQATAFSDCIVISDTNKDSEVGRVLSDVAILSGFLLRNDILCRGAIATGLTVHDDRVLFGIGVINAYEIETQVAFYPRIVIQDDLIQRVTGFLYPNLKRDSDGIWFIDIFGQLPKIEGNSLGLLLSNKPPIKEPDINAFQRARDFIIRSLDETRSDLRRCIKYRWLANQFNEAINDYLPGKIDPISL